MASPCIVTDQGITVTPEWWGWNAVVNSLPRGWTYYADCPTATPTPPPAPQPTDPYFTVGMTAINKTPLTPFDRSNATYSLYATDTNLDQLTRDTYAGLVNPTGAYIQPGSDGQPNLVIPTTSGSSGAPCPQGFVAQTPEVVTQQDLAERIGGQLEAIRVTEAVAPAACKPLPTVTTEGEWVTPNDCLAVTVLKAQATSGLTLAARILDCDGQVHYMTYDLDAIPVGVRTPVTLPITPGYLLDICVSALGSTMLPGAVFASIALQHTCAQGQPPLVVLAAGYVTDTYSVSWPGSTGGAPYTPPAVTPPTGATVQCKAAVGTAGTTIAKLTLDSPVTDGSLLVALTGRAPIHAGDAVSDPLNGAWTRLVQLRSYASFFYVANAKPGTTEVTFTSGYGPGGSRCSLQVVELRGMAKSAPVDADANGSAYVPPLNLTTGATSHADLGVVGVAINSPTNTDLSDVVGWLKIMDTDDGGGLRLVTVLANGLTAPPDALAYSAATSGYVEAELCAFKTL